MIKENDMAKYNSIRDYFRAALIYFVLICTVYSPVVFFGKSLSASSRYPWFQEIPPKADVISILPEIYPNTFNVDLAHVAAYEEPLDVFIGNQIRKGSFPLWNPFLACGTTVIEQFSTRALFPYQLLQDISPWQWREFFLLGRLFIAAMGVFLFLRVLGAGFYPCLCGGIMYGVSGAMTVFLTLTEMSNVAMVMPYTLLAAELLARRPSLITVFFSGLAIALLILGGQPEVSFCGMVLLVLFFFFRIISNRENKLTFVKKTLFFVLLIIFSLLLSSPFFIPFLLNSSHYYTLHAPGGNMGIETPASLANYMAIFLPELLRWRSQISGFTMNAGWDYLGGYIGVAGVFIILAAFREKWWGRPVYLFFLVFALLVLLKNTGFPVINLIGKLPVFDQVWTPRWAGPAWNLSLALCAALGFESLLLAERKESMKVSSAGWALLIAGLLMLALGTLINRELLSVLNNAFGYQGEEFLNKIMRIRPFLVAISAVMLFISARRLNLPKLFFLLSLAVMFCVVNFQAQLPLIEGVFGSILRGRGNLAVFSMWQGMMESALLGLIVILAISIALRERAIHKERLAFIILGIIIIEISFHVTLGYDEKIRLARFCWHFIALAGLILYMLFPKYRLTKVGVRMLVCLFFIGMVAIGRIGSYCLPERQKSIFDKIYTGLIPKGETSRIMGLKGFFSPNAAAALGVQDIRSISSLSIKRFQLFQDYCLLARPQNKYKSLWFTGVMDPSTGKNISGHLEERCAFYSLAGVGNYLSMDYENIPYTKLVSDGKIKNYQNLAVFPRAFIVHKWSTSKNPEESLEWMLSSQSSFGSQAVVEAEEMPLSPDIQGKPSARAEIKNYQLHSVVIEAETNTPGLLILTDVYHPDWLALVDGKKQKIFPADLCFRGVFLNPGRHEVKIFYFPRVFYACTAIGISAFLILLISTLTSIILKLKLRKQTML